MENLLFSSRSIWTMVHGVLLGGGALMALAAALFALFLLRPADGAAGPLPAQATHLSWLLVLAAVLIWITVLAGTYITFPPYRATPPEGLVDLTRYPRSLVLSDPGTAWLHSFGMEIKEHIPWIAGMLVSSVAFVGVRYRSDLLADARLRRAAMTLLGIAFILVAAVALLGVLVNKVAPLE